MIHNRLLKMAFQYLSRRLHRIHPFEVQANLFNACNQKCVYCRCPEVKTDLMTTDQWLDIIRQLSRLGTIRIKFQGGEPTLRPDFRTLCSESKQLGLITAAVSHGVSIASHPDLLDSLDELVVSLDSPIEETNDRLRGKGAYQGAVRAIDFALERGLRTYVNMILTCENHTDLDKMLEFCENRGLKMHAQPAMFKQRSVYGRYFDDSMQKLVLSDEQIRGAHKRMAEWKKEGRQLILSAGTYQKAAAWEDYSTVRTVGWST